MPKTTSRITIEDLRALAGGQFFKPSASFDARAVTKLFFEIKQEWAIGNALANKVREPRTIGATQFIYSFLCIRIKPCPPPFLPKTKLKEISFGFVLLIECSGLVAVFRRGVSGFEDWIENYCETIGRRDLTYLYCNQAVYEKMGLRRMTVSQHELRACGYEASDLGATIPVLGLGRSIPRFLRLNHPNAGTISLTPGTSRVQLSGGRLDIDELAKMVAGVAQELAVGAKNEFLDAFPTPDDLGAALRKPLRPTAILFDLSDLLPSENGDAWHVVVKRKGIPEKDVTEIVKERFSQVIKLRPNGANWRFGKAKSPKGSVSYLSGKFALQLKGPKITVVNERNEEYGLERWLRQRQAFNISFEDPHWFYTQGALYQRADFAREIDIVADSLSPKAGLDTVTSEKGKYKTYTRATTSFDRDSIFSFVENDLCRADKHLLCSDLDDEWADYISIEKRGRKLKLKLLHCKHHKYGKVSDTSGASAFQEVIGQAIKNLGRVQISGTSLKNKVAELLAKQFWTTKVPIPRYHGPGGMQADAEAVAGSPDSEREVLLVVTMLSKGTFDTERAKVPLEPHFIQLVWILSAFIHTCREMGAKAGIICKR